ncbi:MAG: aromatic ring-hydroxylating oxygenase subunit alpha [Janthinobacterium lividum]
MKRDVANPSVDWAIHEDLDRGIFRVHRRAFTDEAVFDLERKYIFDRCWLYLGHESEIAKPGDFVSRTLAGKPLIFNRDRAGKMHVFFNTCTHRGAMVCREEKGRARNFTCPYHGWVFGDDGKLVNQPLPDSYTEACRTDGHLDLHPVPNFDVFAGFIFVNFAPSPESLESYLAGAGEYLKNIAAQDREAMVVVGGEQSYSAHANWKLLQENSADGYHAATTHATYLDYIKNREGEVLNSFTKGFGRVRNLGNGHAVSESQGATPWGRPLARWMGSWGEEIKVELDKAYQEMVDRLGPEKAEWLCLGDRNLLIFPNLVINDISGLVIRTYNPVSPSYFEVSAWALAPKNESAVLRDLRLWSFLEFLGPAGFATPDDQEMLELCQRAFSTNPWVEWSDISRGMATENEGSPAKQDELQMRTFWRRWRDMLAESYQGA